MPPYEIRRAGTSNEWSVVDSATGEILRLDGVLQAGLALDRANEIVDRLNRLALEKSLKPG